LRREERKKRKSKYIKIKRKCFMNIGKDMLSKNIKNKINEGKKLKTMS